MSITELMIATGGVILIGIVLTAMNNWEFHPVIIPICLACALYIGAAAYVESRNDKKINTEIEGFVIAFETQKTNYENALEREIKKSEDSRVTDKHYDVSEFYESEVYKDTILMNSKLIDMKIKIETPAYNRGDKEIKARLIALEEIKLGIPASPTPEVAKSERRKELLKELSELDGE